jgi:Ubiquitin fusion degradation protein UFD1
MKPIRTTTTTTATTRTAAIVHHPRFFSSFLAAAALFLAAGSTVFGVVHASTEFQQASVHHRRSLEEVDPISLRSSPAGILSRRWGRARALAELEQAVEDYNADYVARQSSGSGSLGASSRHRRLICLPLEEDRFDPPPGVFAHGHVQTGDKMSLPGCFWQAIQLNQAEVPWLFALQRVPEPTMGGGGGDRVQFKEISDSGGATGGDESSITEHRPFRALDRVVGGPLDFRAPANYVFVPHYMMRALGLRPLDVVQVDQVTTVPPGSLAKLRPHSRAFARDVSNPQAVLEVEFRHYSSLTAGTVIAMDYNGKRYWFDVVELRSAPRGEKVPVVKVQDCWNSNASERAGKRQSRNKNRRRNCNQFTTTLCRVYRSQL